MKNLLWCALALSITITSCKKDKDESTPEPQTPSTDYYKLKTGNYWVYERWKVDTNGVETNLGILDSAYITSDIVINGNTYYDYRYVPFNSSPNYVRDSAGCLVTVDGQIMCSSNTSIGSFYSSYVMLNTDTIADVDYSMANGISPVTVAAGTFSCIKVNCANTFRPPFDVTINVGQNPKTFNDYYTNGIGKIKYGYYYSSMPDRIECRLLRYSVQ